jgi:6-pyruvoyltetrahydropterin/6-carboxytetrahydropterin synthase
MLLSQEFRFSAAHKLTGNVGQPLHGHNYQLIVTIKGAPDKNGVVSDTAALRKIVDDIVLKKLDNSFLNDLFPQPTMENIVKWVWQELIDLTLHEIILYETPQSYVTYHGD